MNKVLTALLICMLVYTSASAKILPSLLNMDGDTSKYAISVLNTHELTLIPIRLGSYQGTAEVVVYENSITCETCIIPKPANEFVTYTGTTAVQCFNCFKIRWYKLVETFTQE